LDDYNCAICSSGVEETCMHLFFECPLSITCWKYIGIHWNLDLPHLEILGEASSGKFLSLRVGPRNRLIFDAITVLLLVGKKASRMKLAWFTSRPNLALQACHMSNGGSRWEQAAHPAQPPSGAAAPPEGEGRARWGRPPAATDIHIRRITNKGKGIGIGSVHIR
jgi:hypothetical protein